MLVCAHLWLLAAPGQAAESMGRLFFTPEQRTALDAARSKKTKVNLTTETETPADKPPPPPTPEVITFDGLVRRSDGKATVWINDRPVDEKSARSGPTLVGKVRADGSVTVQSSQTGRSVDLRVGQRGELLSGRVEEGFATRNIAARPDAAGQESKPAGKSSEAGAKEDREREERERRRDLEDAVRTLKDTAESLNKPAPHPGSVQVYPPPKP